MMDSADPFNGWGSDHVIGCSYGSAVNDIYGRLFNYLRQLLTSFIKQTNTRKVALELYNMDVIDLPKYLNSKRFARIEVIKKMCNGDTILIEFYRSPTYLTVATSELHVHSFCSVHSYKSVLIILTRQY
jgi:hypothetical protein